MYYVSNHEIYYKHQSIIYFIDKNVLQLCFTPGPMHYNHMHLYSSEFICPVSGLYLFYATLMSEKNGYGRIVMKVNGEHRAAIYPDGRSMTYGHSSNLIMVECHPGQKVWMECAMDGTMVNVNPLWHYNTFSGMLLHQFEH